MLEIAMLMAAPLLREPEIRPDTTQPLSVSASACANLEGNWRGSINRASGQRLDVIISIQGNCSYVWRSPAGQVYTPGRLSQNGNTLNYANEAGSRGVVTVGSGMLEWRNIHTGNNYVVQVRR